MRWLALVFVVACHGSSSEPVSPKVTVGDHGVDIANLTAQLPPYLDSIGGGEANHGFSGYLLVAQHDHVIFSGAYGMADREKQHVASSETSFRVGSVTKQFTAAAILRLEQDGKLSTEDKVSKHLPEFPGPGKDVTIHQLLTHTAGIWNFTEDPALLAHQAEKMTPRQVLEMFWDKPLDFPAGSKFAYSNSGYCILGAIIEKASGMAYGDYLAKMLFGPAKLTRTVVGDAIGDPERAEGYEIAEGKLVRAKAIDMSFPYAAGGVRSTAIDLLRWHRALSTDGVVLGAAARKKLHETVGLGDYGYGWVHKEVHGHAGLWHNGGIDGFATIFWRVPDADLVVLGWSNVESTHIDPVGLAAVGAAFGDKVKPIEKRVPGTLDPGVVARVAGSYGMADGELARLTVLKLPTSLLDTIATIELTAGPKGVLLKPVGQGSVELLPLADGSFFDSEHDIHVRFEIATSGPVTMALEQGPLAIKYRRK